MHYHQNPCLTAFFFFFFFLDSNFSSLLKDALLGILTLVSQVLPTSKGVLTNALQPDLGSSSKDKSLIGLNMERKEELSDEPVLKMEVAVKDEIVKVNF